MGRKDQVVKTGRFSKDEIEFIKKFYPTMGSVFCANHLNRQWKAIKDKAGSLQIKRVYPSYEEGHTCCFSCQKILPFSDFPSYPTPNNKKKFYCLKCKQKNQNKNKIKRRQNPTTQLREVAKGLFYSAKQRAREKNIEFNLTIDFLENIIPSVCPVFLTKFKFFAKNRCNNSPSIDRINSDLGYTQDNVKIISWKANDLKCNASIDQIKQIMNYLKNE